MRTDIEISRQQENKWKCLATKKTYHRTDRQEESQVGRSADGKTVRR